MLIIVRTGTIAIMFIMSKTIIRFTIAITQNSYNRYNNPSYYNSYDKVFASESTTKGLILPEVPLIINIKIKIILKMLFFTFGYADIEFVKISSKRLI